MSCDKRTTWKEAGKTFISIEYITPYVLGPVDCKVGLFATV